MKQSMVCTIRFIVLLSIASCISFYSVGCGVQQKKQQTEDIRQVATGAAVYVGENKDSEAVQKQLELLVTNARKWRIDGDENKSNEIAYAVTDLDRDGRLELMVLGYDLESGYCLQKCFEVNSSADGIEGIGTEQIQEIPLGDDGIERLSMAYYEPNTGEYYYVLEDGWHDGDDDADIIALTLKDGQIIKSAFGSWEQVDKKTGGKFDVWFSTFAFDHSLEDMSEKQIYHALEKSYGESFQGYPLEKQKKKIHGYQIAIPQYSTIQDSGKQKRINQMICEQVEQSLSNVYDLQDSAFDLSYADITIKYAGRNRVSLLLEACGYREGAVSANEHCDTITIDLEQERILTGRDILPEQYQEEVEESILYGDSEACFRGGDVYLERIEDSEALFPTQRAEGWQDVKIYQTRDNVGVVIPVKFGLDAYVIYEVWHDWHHEEYEGIAYSDVDWEAYQYKLLAPEYQSLQDYMPVLIGGSEFTLVEKTYTEDEEEIERRNLTIGAYAREWAGENSVDEALHLSCISICDLTQDGKAELILSFLQFGGGCLVLHKEEDGYYGTFYGKRSLQCLRKNGVYSAGKGGLYLYQTRFEQDTFIETYLGGYKESSEDPEDCKYYIGDKEVGENAYKKWKKSITAEEVPWYTPEILQEKSGASGW